MSDIDRRIRTLENITNGAENNISAANNDRFKLEGKGTIIAMVVLPLMLFLVLYFWNPQCMQVEDEMTGETKKSIKRMMGTTLLIVGLAVGGYFGYRYYRK